MLIRTIGSSLSAIALLLLGSWQPAGAQVAPAKEGAMLTPPPVSVNAYPKEVASEARTNYLRLGMNFSGGYIDNLFAGSGNAVLAEKFFSLRPLIALDTTSYRQQTSLIYSPGFTFYQPTSDLNQTDQNLVFNYRFRVTPHGRIDANDFFQQGASSFSAAGGISGSTPGSSTGIIAPFAQRLTNTADGQYSLQFSPNAMVGITGRMFDLHFPKTEQVPGLYDSHERGGGGFYSWRFSSTQYVGVTYRYTSITANPQNVTDKTQTQTTNLYYTIYPRHGLSFSVSAGPQKYTVETSTPTTPAVTTGDWSPGVTASFGWQGSHTNLSAGYSRTVAAGNGLLGTFRADSASASGRWQAARTWILGANVNYANLKPITQLPIFSTTLGGHSIAGMVTVEHALSAHFNLQFEYDRLHQSYAGIPAITSNPDSDREMLSIQWQLSRPLGR